MAFSTAPQADTLDPIFEGLRNASHDVRAKSALELQRISIPSTFLGVSPLPAMQLPQDILSRIFNLVRGQTTAEKLGGLLAIDHLLMLTGVADHMEPELFRFYNYAQAPILDADTTVQLAASKTLGRIIKLSGPAFGQYFMDYEVQSAISHLDGDHQGRHAGVLVLKELARNSPAYFHLYISKVLKRIPAVLRDTQLLVRESAAELLAACVEIVAQREPQELRDALLLEILQGAREGLDMPAPETIHGSLLAFRELLLHGEAFMKHNINDTERILSLKTNADPLVRKTVIDLVPILSVYDTNVIAHVDLADSELESAHLPSSVLQ